MTPKEAEYQVVDACSWFIKDQLQTNRGEFNSPYPRQLHERIITLQVELQRIEKDLAETFELY